MVTKEEINQKVAKFVNVARSLFHDYDERIKEARKGIEQGNFVLSQLKHARNIETRPNKLAWLNAQIDKIEHIQNDYKRAEIKNVHGLEHLKAIL